jgi:glycosyltransferase involved in cell wall biosynthesis
VSDFQVGVVVPVALGREDNLRAVLRALDDQTYRPRGIVLVYDGCPSYGICATTLPTWDVEIPKHQPGAEQPRNVGVRKLEEVLPDCNYVWFLDSDLEFAPDCLEQYAEASALAPEPHVMIGPYDWLRRGVVGCHPECPEDVSVTEKPDDRWVSFRGANPATVARVGDDGNLRAMVGYGLACFSGNLVWNIEEFKTIGGFHPEMHHGRCEDGELGLRAISQGVGVSLVPTARAYHRWHDVDHQWVLDTNRVDVPMINRLHPWVEDEGLIMTAKDGIRFDFRCPKCGTRVNTLEYWNHAASCGS